ncbi:hypothetical protein EPUS_09389 [Endocarpon pusillum Z07020]|uniref:DNA 3'-5' helicase n=1 Tax=Endocarpon pusillum (strain Z07020 / HMAS-L-300199) TaxID=1263415 RepID=U1HNG9_ENDPU|nr:uncharacterized protein EPUS_09389 [Endocarpon pusillum Z07020]ERF71905.1 hypothetical protein EPUS_09389 [Endocarpon pusillum Z07020]
MSSTSSPILSSSASVVNAHVTISPVTYLRAHADLGVLLCTEHCSGYTLQNYGEHLKRAHGVKGQLKKRIQEWVEAQHISERVTQPSHYQAPLPGLAILSGWKCNIDDCMFLTQSEQIIFRHGSSEHNLNCKRQQREGDASFKVQMQTLFTKSREYFIVDPMLKQQPLPSISSLAVSTLPLSDHLRIIRVSDSAESAGSLLSERFWSSQETFKDKYRQIEEPVHTSELSPWLRLCKYHEHLSGIDVDLIASSRSVPKSEADDVFLYHVSKAVERVLQAASALIADLHHVDARRLNTFQPGTLSQDPLEHLQEEHSLSHYILTFTKLICYFCRVINGHFNRNLFEITSQQYTAQDLLRETVESYMDFLSSKAQSTSDQKDDDSSESISLETPDDPEHEEQIGQLRQEINRQTLKLCTALVQHPISTTGTQTAILSYCAIAAWDESENTWRKEDQCGSTLSQLIYCCQIIILAHAHELVRCGQHENVSNALKPLCAAWIVNDEKTPVSDMNRLRLYAMTVSRNTVNPEDPNKETLNYAGITYEIKFLAQEITFYLDHTRTIFERDLCLGLPDIPTYPLDELRDNWDSCRPGCSFLDDPRNAGILAGGQEWLWENIQREPELRHLVLRRNQEEEGSGQPARRKEFLGMRWQNVGFTKRNVFVHDGHVLFLLTYHKSLSRTHASRHPARFLLPEVGQLLVQFLVLITPIRRYFHREVLVPVDVSEYLWSGGSGIWPEDKMTRIVKSMSQQAIGEKVNMQSWRQISVGIAIKKFSGLTYEADLDLPGDEDDDLSGTSILNSFGGAMADVFHHQAAHSVQTGNRAYGGTINFNSGLTDAGLQEYFRASRMWHQLCQPRPTTNPSITGHRRQASSLNPPLIKRVALRQQPRRHRRRWGEQTVLETLQQLYPQTKPAQFKTEKQAQLISSIVTGYAEVIGILGTGEGKSLSFMLPVCLPHAATTVVVVPLVALKTDIVRRCLELNIAYSIWNRHANPQQYVGCSLLFVAIEEAVSRRFRTFLGQLDASESLDRLVFDKSHLILTASRYRPKMALVKELREYRCQVVFLTATLPPLMQAQFERRLLLAQPRTIRSCTFRSDLYYHVQRSSRPGDFLEYMTRGIRTALQHLEEEAAARVIVYAQSRGEADQVSQRLSCPVYYSDSGSSEEKEEAFEQWRRGTSRVIVATSAFGMGVDYPHVRAVIHMGAPQDMISFAQEVGRLGRDGRGGTSRVVLPHHWQSNTSLSRTEPEFQTLPELAMQTYLGHCRCLAAVLSRFQDGGEHMQYCSREQRHQWCTRCQQFGRLEKGQDADHTAFNSLSIQKC